MKDITFSPYTPQHERDLMKRYRLVRVGVYSGELGMGANGSGYALVGFDTARGEDPDRFIASEMLVLHVVRDDEGSYWRAEGVITNIKSDHDFSNLLELIVQESGIDGAEVVT